MPSRHALRSLRLLGRRAVREAGRAKTLPSQAVKVAEKQQGRQGQGQVQGPRCIIGARVEEPEPGQEERCRRQAQPEPPAGDRQRYGAKQTQERGPKEDVDVGIHWAHSSVSTYLRRKILVLSQCG